MNNPRIVNLKNHGQPSVRLAKHLEGHRVSSPGAIEDAQRFCKRSYTDHICRAFLPCVFACVASDDQC